MIRISDAELEVMEIIWKNGEATSFEIINQLNSTKWNDNTIRTLINRLATKKAIGIASKSGKTYTYVPLIKEEEYKKKRSKNFVQQLFNGSVHAMMLNFVDDKEITKEELNDLINRLDNK